MGYAPKWDDVEVGDKIVVEITGKVNGVAPNFVAITHGQDGYPAPRTLAKDYTTLKSVEKPVRRFKPGDVIKARSKRFDPGVYTIGEGNRFFDHTYAKWFDYYVTDFNTDHYKVTK